MSLFILICHLATCDRIVQPVETCINSEFQAQVIVAETGLYQDGDRMVVECRKERR